MTNSPARTALPSLGSPLNLRYGGACAWQLPPDQTCASYARSRLTTAMTALGLPTDLIDDATLAVSELATNALLHATHPTTPTPWPELWTWARVHPSPQLVITTFDTDRTHLPRPTTTPPAGETSLATSGRGLGIVSAIAADWGVHPTRSRFGARPTPGKAVWCAFPLSEPWPRNCLLPPAQAAGRLHKLLTYRGVDRVLVSNAPGVSLVSLPCGLNIRVEPKSFTFNDTNGHPTRRPLLDLQDLAEHLIRRTEETTKR
ncbi:ATP-binding protein [Actinomadura craniellae]|nr:ATP-binding protein [Actinomadura craniellae]